MLKSDFINLVINNKNSNCNRDHYIKSHYLEFYDEIIYFNKTNFIDNNFSFKQKLYNYVYNINIISKCPVCNNEVKWNNSNNKYSIYCSNLCINKDINIKNKIKKTNNNKYGSDYIFQRKDIKDKIKVTNLNNYGVEYISQSKEIRKKIINTNLINLGVSYPTQSKLVKDKIKLTLLKNYGVDHPMKSELIKNKSINSLTSKTIEKSKIIFGDNIIILNNGNNNFLIKHQCKIHDEYIINKKVYYWRVISNNNENPCIICNPIGENASLKENEIRDFIENDLNIKTEKDNKILNGKEIDIYIPTHNLGIEFDGLYWHSNIYKDKNYHLNKTNLCEENNIQLLHVFEDEWFYKKDIVKSIIKSKLGIYNQKIFARKCIIKEININESTKFLNDNHLQGNIGSKVKLGLFYNNELVSLMTFGNKRVSMGNKIKTDGEYEMLRFCNKLNTTVIGGASKLLSYFIKNHNPKSILSFADRRYSNGNLYKELGFKQLENTKPNYWYFKNNSLDRYHRFGFRKDVLVKQGFDAQLTEHQIMDERGYLRIYDCGNMKFILYN